MDRHLRFFDDWFSAYNSHDLDALCALADPHVEIRPLENSETAVPGATYHGHEGIRSLFEPGFRRFPRLRIEPNDPVASANHVIVPMTLVLDDEADPPLMRFAAAVYTFAGDRVRLIESYETVEEAKRSTGHPTALTPREREVMTLVSKGLRAEDVAARLVLSPFTVRTHIRNARDRLGARTTAHAIAIAIRDHELEQDSAA